MSLRLTDEESQALWRRADAEGRSMEEVARAAVREYVEQHERTEELDRTAAWVMSNFGEALDRLRQPRRVI